MIRPSVQQPTVVRRASSSRVNAQVEAVVAEAVSEVISMSPEELQIAIDDRLEGKIKGLYGGILEKHAELLIPSATNKYLANILDGLVAKIVQEKIPSHLSSYLNNNNDMQQIIKRHEAKLRSRLNNEAGKVLNDLVRKDDYHVINKGYFDEFKKRGMDVTSKWLEENNELQNKVSSLTKDVKDLNATLQNLSSFVWTIIMGVLIFSYIAFMN